MIKQLSSSDEKKLGSIFKLNLSFHVFTIEAACKIRPKEKFDFIKQRRWKKIHENRKEIFLRSAVAKNESKWKENWIFDFNE